MLAAAGWSAAVSVSSFLTQLAADAAGSISGGGGSIVSIRNLTLACIASDDGTFLAAKATVNSSVSMMNALATIASLGLSSSIYIQGAVTESPASSPSRPSSGFILAPNTSLHIFSSSPSVGLLDLGMEQGLINATGANVTVILSNLTLVNLCSALDVVNVPDYRFGNISMTSSILVNYILRRPNAGPQSLVIRDSVMYVPRREMHYLAYWYVCICVLVPWPLCAGDVCPHSAARTCST